MYKLYLNRVAIGGFVVTPLGKYWSSSDHAASSIFACYVYFYNGDKQYTFSKGSLLKVRAVRSF